jgi:renalase
MKAGFDVRVFEKSRGLGGRLAVRRVEGIGSFDIGAQFMTADSEPFSAVIREFVSKGVIAPWDGRIVHISESGTELAHPRARYVGVPGMNAWIKKMGPTERIETSHQVGEICRTTDGKWMIDGNQVHLFDGLALAIPAPQARALLQSVGPLPDATEALISSESMEPCWCVYMAFDSPVQASFDGAFVRHPGSAFSWLARDSSKPGRKTDRDHWVLHASPEWSRQHFDRSPTEIEALLLADFASLVGDSLPPLAHIGSHRWRYAAPIGQGSERVHWDLGLSLGVAGDWVIGGRVEGAYLAGMALARAIADTYQS